jgi:hypothetical protein
MVQAKIRAQSSKKRIRGPSFQLVVQRGVKNLMPPIQNKKKSRSCGWSSAKMFLHVTICRRGARIAQVDAIYANPLRNLSHMLVHCSFTLTVWKELEAQSGLINA